jgi:hypothetical protein
MTVITDQYRAQSLAHLKHGNEIRCDRAKLRHALALGIVSAATVILECPPEAQTWPIGELLMCQRRWGVSRMRGFLRGMSVRGESIPEGKTVGSFTLRQALVVSAALGARTAAIEEGGRER